MLTRIIWMLILFAIIFVVVAVVAAIGLTVWGRRPRRPNQEKLRQRPR